MYKELWVSEDHTFDNSKTKIEKIYKGFDDEKKAKAFCACNGTAQAKIVSKNELDFDFVSEYVVAFYVKVISLRRDNKTIGFYIEDVTIDDMKKFTKEVIV